MDLQNLIERILEDGDINTIASNVRAQFGTRTRRYLGATFLPERLVNDLEYEESEIRFKTVIANDGTRYSPAQLKDSGALMASMKVSLGHSDISRQFTSRDYDGVIKMLGSGRSIEAAAVIVGWVDAALNLALIELDEKHRWEAMLSAFMIRRGDNGYTEPIYYANPVGHRVTAVSQWSNPAYDPWLDITAGAQKLYDKGYEINRIVTSRRIMTILSNNPNIVRRVVAVPVVVGLNGTLTTVSAGMRISLDQINGALAAEGLPLIERNDQTYSTQVGTARFFPQDTFFMAATTGRDIEIAQDVDDDPLLVPNALGYTAIGPPAGYSNPGRQIYVEAHKNKAPRITGEAWQASLPVLQDPEAVYVISGIS